MLFCFSADFLDMIGNAFAPLGAGKRAHPVFPDNVLSAASAAFHVAAAEILIKNDADGRTVAGEHEPESNGIVSVRRDHPLAQRCPNCSLGPLFCEVEPVLQKNVLGELRHGPFDVGLRNGVFHPIYPPQ